MSARDNILKRLRSDAALVRRAPPLRPALQGNPVACFIRELQAAAGTLCRLSSLAQVPAAVMDYRASNRIDGSVAVAPVLARLPWPDDLRLDVGTTDGVARLAVSQAQAAVAETGSLVMVSGAATPTRLNFLPEHQLVVLHAGSVLRHLEDALQLVDVSMPRALNLITGPSRTADVEQTIQLGAHGPRALQVLFIDESSR